jgi:hypothetical protein
MDYTSLQQEGEALGECVEALASAHRHVIEAKSRIQRFENLRSRLIETGQIEAAEVAMSLIKCLGLDLGHWEAMLTAASHSVRRAFDIATSHDAPSPSHGAPAAQHAF